MNMQHNMAIWFADLFDSEQLLSRENRLFLIFGIEVFLNEFLKVLFAWSCGLLLGILPKVIFATFFLLLLRRYAGGKHFKSNVICFITSVLCMVCPALIAEHLLFSLKGIKWIVIVECMILVFFAPFYRKEKLAIIQRYIKKFLVLISYTGGIIFAAGVGGLEYINIVLVLGGVEAASIIRKK